MEPFNLLVAIAFGLLAYLMDMRMFKIKARHRINCRPGGDDGFIILPDGRHMGIGVTSITTTSEFDDIDRVVIEGHLLRGGKALFQGQRDSNRPYKESARAHAGRFEALFGQAEAMWNAALRRGSKAKLRLCQSRNGASE